jgi:hypothetical protein
MKLIHLLFLFVALSEYTFGQKFDSTGVVEFPDVVQNNVNVNTESQLLPLKDVVPVSPDAAQLGLYGAVPVGLFTGTIQHSIPLYEFKTRNLKLPIALNYNSNGLIVDKIASWVGFDWSLNAGGSIVMSVRGEWDFHTYNNIRRSVPENSVLNDPQALNSWLSENWTMDFQPDIFNFNLPGDNGKFFLDVNGMNYYTIPYKNIKVEITYNSTQNLIDYFTIVTPDGIRYEFKAKEYTYCYYCAVSEGYPVSWYLTSIIHPTGETIKLYYSQTHTNPVSYYSGLFQQVTKCVHQDCLFGGFPVGNPCTDPDYYAIAKVATNQAIYLDSICSEGFGSIVFIKSGDRQDYVDGQRLNQIIIKNPQQEVIRKIQLTQHFAASNSLFPRGNPLNYEGSLSNDHINELGFRMFLDALYFCDSKDKIIEQYGMEYYNLENLPSRLSFSQDHWGYFNGAANYWFVPSGYIQPQYLSFFPPSVGGNRNPNGQYSINGMLKRITYPTGGYTIIEYEPNHTGSKEVGGCRVAKTSSYESTSAVPDIKRYYYNISSNLNTSYGLTQQNPAYVSEYPSYFVCTTTTGGAAVGKCEYVSLSSSSLYPNYLAEQGSVVYPAVTVSHGNNFENGGETHQFIVQYDTPGLPLTMCAGLVSPLPFSNTGWYCGTKASEYYFKKNPNGGMVNVKSTTYNYNMTDTRHAMDYRCMSITRRSIPTDISGIINTYDNLKSFNAVTYTMKSYWQQPVSTITTEYDENGNVTLSNSTSYVYDELNHNHTQLSKETSVDSKGTTLIKKYYYPQDYNLTKENFQTLVYSKFIINKPVDVRTYADSKLTSLDQFKYNDFGLLTDYYQAEIGPNQNDIVLTHKRPIPPSSNKNTLMPIKTLLR